MRTQNYVFPQKIVVLLIYIKYCVRAQAPLLMKGRQGGVGPPFLFIHSSFFAEERRIRKKRRRPELKGTHTSFFKYSMNSLRSNSISYLVTQPKVETRYNKKTCMLFSLFVRNADMPAGLSFLLQKFNDLKNYVSKSVA